MTEAQAKRADKSWDNLQPPKNVTITNKGSFKEGYRSAVKDAEVLRRCLHISILYVEALVMGNQEALDKYEDFLMLVDSVLESYRGKDE